MVFSLAVIEDVLALGDGLECSYQVHVRGKLNFRVGQIVYVAFSLDERIMGFAFPKEERSALAGGEPCKSQMSTESVVRQKFSCAYDLAHRDGPG